MAPRAATPTRETLLAAAEGLINDQGFAATSIDQIIDRAGVTKGTFFYHFKSKNDLARALVDRYARGDQELLHSSMERATRLADDPLQQLLIFVGLLIEVAEQLDETEQPGCLFATYCFEMSLFDDDTLRVIADGFAGWRDLVGERLRAAAELHPPRLPVDLDSVADMLIVLFEGAFVISRSTPGPGVFAAQLGAYRAFLQLLFDAAGAA